MLVADIYAAGETPLVGFEKEDLASGLRQFGHRDPHVLASPDQLGDIIANIAQPGDLVMCLGAGSITHWAAALPEQLAQKRGSSVMKEGQQ